MSKPEAVSTSKQGEIADVGIAHRRDAECLKSIPNGSENDNLGNLPSAPREHWQGFLFESLFFVSSVSTFDTQ